MKARKHSALYRHIENLHAERPWGHVLDAGTGDNSLRWLSSLDTQSWTAVTGSMGEANRTQANIAHAQRPQDKLVLGNWADRQFMQGEIFDTVLADYLLGAIEGFSPYFQPYLLCASASSREMRYM